MTPSLKTYYKDKVAPALKEQLKLTNVHEIPSLEKIVVTTHVGKYMADRKAAVEDAVQEITKITGQKPSTVFARKSVANFKVREGEAVGAPNIRDFRGIPPKSFDGRGNYAVGFADQSIFPEIELDKIKRQLGFDIIFVTSTNDNDQAKALLSALGMPFREIKKKEDSEETADAPAA